MTTEDEIRRVLHPEAHEPMRYEPRIPLGCDQQGRYPQAAEPCVDLDELGVKLPPQEPWWPYILGAVVSLLALVLVFGGVLK
jgi:hypothetical protein